MKRLVCLIGCLLVGWHQVLLAPCWHGKYDVREHENYTSFKFGINCEFPSGLSISHNLGEVWIADCPERFRSRLNCKYVENEWIRSGRIMRVTYPDDHELLISYNLKKGFKSIEFTKMDIEDGNPDGQVCWNCRPPPEGKRYFYLHESKAFFRLKQIE